MRDKDALSAPEAVETLFLKIDKANRIIAVSDNWDATAKAGNAAPSAYEASLIGQSLAAFISDDATLMYVETAIKFCRLKQQELVKPYRCDSPTHKRFMEMVLTPLDNQEVAITHRLLRTEPFEQPFFFKDITHSLNDEILQSAGHNDKSKLHKSHYSLRCSMCNAIKIGDTWLPPEQVDGADELNPVLVIHTVCPACKDSIWQVRK